METLRNHLHGFTRSVWSGAGASAIVIACVVWVLTVPIAYAHQDHGPVTLNYLTRNAVMIVEGKIEAVSSAWNQARTRIHTTVRVVVDTYHKGGDGAGAVQFRLLGGTVGRETLAVLGQPTFEKDERVFLFFRPNWESRDTPILKMEHGKFSVRTDPRRQIELIENVRGESLERSAAVEEIRSINAGEVAAANP